MSQYAEFVLSLTFAILIVLVLEADPATRWLADLTGSKLPDLPPTAEPRAPEQPDAVEETPLG